MGTVKQGKTWFPASPRQQLPLPRLFPSKLMQHDTSVLQQGRG